MISFLSSKLVKALTQRASYFVYQADVTETETSFLTDGFTLDATVILIAVTVV
ncbi:TPA: hypothetical protein K8E43_003057, partial [Listeria monocytogenes]|nr:hypothetical protein [Listeria monocytogenes]